MTHCILFVELHLGFKMSPTDCSNSTLCQTTSSDKRNRDPKIANFKRNAKLAFITLACQNHPPPPCDPYACIHFLWEFYFVRLCSLAGEMGRVSSLPVLTASGSNLHWLAPKKTQNKKPVSLSFRPRVVSLEAIAMRNCLDMFCASHTGLADTKVQSLGYITLAKLGNGDTPPLQFLPVACDSRPWGGGGGHQLMVSLGGGGGGSKGVHHPN